MKVRRVKKNGKSLWMADLGKIGDKRQRKFFHTQAEAQTFAGIKRQEKEDLGKVALALPQEVRLAAIDAQQRLAPYGASITQAVDYFLAHASLLKPKVLLEAIEECIAAKIQAGCRKRYTGQINSSLHSFVAKIPGKQCHEVRREDVESWLNGNGWQAPTRRSYLIDVRMFFAFAKRRGWVTTDPCDGIEAIRLEDKPPCIFTPSEVSALLEKAQAEESGILPMLVLGIFAGIRPQEIFRLDWKAIDLERAQIEVAAERSKTRRRRIVHLAPNAVTWLRLGGDMPPKNWQARLNRVRKASGVNWGHDIMRHSFASYHLAAHQSADQTALEMGNSPQILFAHYRELVKKEDAEEFWKIMPETIDRATKEDSQSSQLAAM